MSIIDNTTAKIIIYFASIMIVSPNIKQNPNRFVSTVPARVRRFGPCDSDESERRHCVTAAPAWSFARRADAEELG